MNRKIYLILSILVIILLAGCSKEEKTESGVKITDNKIVTDEVSYIDGESEVTIHRNKVTKKASVLVIYKIKDEDEYADFFGSKMTSAPFLINLTCSIFNAAVFEPEKLEDINETEESEVHEGKMNSYLDGYETDKISIDFIDAENNEAIASCESTQAGNDNIEFEVFRDYSDVGSMFGLEIGKYDYEDSTQ